MQLSNASTSRYELARGNIEDIPPGDQVRLRDEYGRNIGLKHIKEVYHRTFAHLRHVTFEAEDGVQQTLSATDERPVWSVPANKFVAPHAWGLNQTAATVYATDAVMSVLIGDSIGSRYDPSRVQFLHRDGGCPELLNTVAHAQ